MTPLRYLRQRGTWATEAWVMARDLGISKRNALRTLLRLESQGDAVRVRPGFYIAKGVL